LEPKLNLFTQGIQPFFLKGLVSCASDFGFSITDQENLADLRVLVDPLKKVTINNKRDVIILAEPEVVRPDLYTQEFLKNTKYLLPLGRYRADRLNLEHFVNWPVQLPTYKRVKNIINQKFVIVNEHKFSSSKRSQYGLRREVIKYFERNKPGTLDVYGVEWNISKSLELKRRFYAFRNSKSIKSVDLKETFSDLWRKYDSVKGHMHQDCEMLQEYMASICIENDIDYVSEKVWKSLYAGCPVIYVGPDLKYDLALKDSVMFAEDNINSIQKKIDILNSISVKDFSSKGFDFLNSSAFNDYSIESKSSEFFSNLKTLLRI
jgi:hypothetical protein